VLAPHGLLVLRMSAYPWLAGPHDVAFNTGRRYGRREVTALLSEHGFVLERTTYANTLLSAPVIALRLMQRWGMIKLEPSLYLAPWLNRLLRYALLWEARWLRWGNLPAGISLYLVARRV
jgi:hypothetical protein